VKPFPTATAAHRSIATMQEETTQSTPNVRCRPLEWCCRGVRTGKDRARFSGRLQQTWLKAIFSLLDQCASLAIPGLWGRRDDLLLDHGPPVGGKLRWEVW
jgi:hypothetical protein